MLSYTLGRVNDFHWGFKPVSSIANHFLFKKSVANNVDRANLKDNMTKCPVQKQTL